IKKKEGNVNPRLDWKYDPHWMNLKLLKKKSVELLNILNLQMISRKEFIRYPWIHKRSIYTKIYQCVMIKALCRMTMLLFKDKYKILALPQRCSLWYSYYGEKYFERNFL